jgi:hypothetical protein
VYDDLARGWRQLVLKKKSSGPTIGKPSLRSRQLFFMACYDIDRFREFVFADSFAKLFDLKPEERESFATDDAALLQFAFRFLRQVMFGEESIALNAEAAQERLVKVQEKRLIEEREAAKKRALETNPTGQTKASTEDSRRRRHGEKSRPGVEYGQPLDSLEVLIVAGCQRQAMNDCH